MAASGSLESRLKLSGVLLILGLLAESICLLWSRPLSFVFMVSLGGPLVFAGIAVYLLSIASSPSRDAGSRQPKEGPSV